MRYLFGGGMNCRTKIVNLKWQENWDLILTMFMHHATILMIYG